MIGNKNRAESVLKELKELASNDLDPESGKLFSHIYDHGDPVLKELIQKAYQLYMNKTMLDFTVYPSILKMEMDLVKFGNKIFHNEGGVGNFTYGGTESIIVMMKACREYYRRIRGKDFVPEMIIPSTGHPAFFKGALYLGYKIKVIQDMDEDYSAKADALNELISKDTALIVGSAPNYPYGTIDDIEGFSDIAKEKDIWLHVDACIGGFVLPFIERLGHKTPLFDFRLEGVTSLSADLHKYGYAPKGASLILYRDKEHRFGQIYVHSSWPGYPLVNTTVLSSRSAGPLAASWAIVKYLGIEGYKELTDNILTAKRIIMGGLRKLGLDIIGNPVSSIVAFTTWDHRVFQICDMMKKKGWYIQAQPGSKKLEFPPSIHLTISPIHHKYAEQFIEILKETLDEIKPMEINVENIMYALGLEAGLDTSLLGNKMDLIIEMLGIDKESISGELSMINILMHELPPEIVEFLLAHIINRLFIP